MRTQAQQEMFDGMLDDDEPTVQETEERLRRRYAMVRGLPDDASWEDIEEHDSRYRREHKGVIKIAGDQSAESLGSSLMSSDVGVEKSWWDPLALSVEAHSWHGATAEDADNVLVSPRSSRSGSGASAVRILQSPCSISLWQSYVGLRSQLAH